MYNLSRSSLSTQSLFSTLLLGLLLSSPVSAQEQNTISFNTDDVGQLQLTTLCQPKQADDTKSMQTSEVNLALNQEELTEEEEGFGCGECSAFGFHGRFVAGYCVPCN